MTAMSTFLSKAQNWTDKALWGIRSVGAAPMLKGMARCGYLYLRRPARSELQLRSGQILEFEFPNQAPRVLLIFGDYIDPEFAFLRRIARPDWTVADVGAAIGQFTVFAATLPVAQVHSFEPSVVNLEVLARNVQRNGVCSRVVVHQLAFSDTEAEAYFETTASPWVGQLSDAGTELVAVRTLTDEFARLALDHVSILKINVAGYEPKVLAGAEPFLAKRGADILILLLGLGSLPWYAKIAAYGFRFFYFHPVQGTLYEVTAFDERAVLGSRPWPARHIIALSEAAIKSCREASIGIRQSKPTAKRVQHHLWREEIRD
jgi:FkbM family methyltransferase